MGGHKGYGIAMVIDMLCGVLSGANLSCETESMFSVGGVANIGHFISVIKIEQLMPEEEFVRRVETWFDLLKASRLRPGVKEILIPGELENLRVAETHDTLEISDKTMAALRELSD